MFHTTSGRDITYNGKEHTKDIKSNNSNINSVNDLFKILLDAWCKETAYPSCQSDYIHEKNPTYGQCAITAVLVHDLFGGTIHKISVDSTILTKLTGTT